MIPFDPYLNWLGIPAHEQPPNLYRLLGIVLFESNPQVIEQAADRQSLAVGAFQAGPQGELCQRLLSEIAMAKYNLLDPQQKAGYDAYLQETLAYRGERAVAAAPPPSILGPATFPAAAQRYFPPTAHLPAQLPLPPLPPLPQVPLPQAPFQQPAMFLPPIPQPAPAQPMMPPMPQPQFGGPPMMPAAASFPQTMPAVPAGPAMAPVAAPFPVASRAAANGAAAAPPANPPPCAASSDGRIGAADSTARPSPPGRQEKAEGRSWQVYSDWCLRRGSGGDRNHRVCRDTRFPPRRF